MEQSETLVEQPVENKIEGLEQKSEELPPASDEAGASDAQTPKGEVNPKPEDEEIEIEVGGKKFLLKQGDAVKYLENISQLTEREKKLLEQERAMNRDYTQKSQANKEFQKSIASVFGGRMPESQELQALGKLIKSYFADPLVQQTLDSILTGNFREFLKSTGKNIPDQEAIEERVARLIDQRFGTYDEQMKARQQEESIAAVHRIIDDFVAKKQQSGAKVQDSIKESMMPFMQIVAQQNPKWTDEQIMERAFKMVTLDEVQKDAVNNVLLNAERAKNAKPPQINSKTPKGEASKSYKDTILEAV